jgi:hypothetical protein
MNKSRSTMSRRIAVAASNFERQRTDHPPRTVPLVRGWPLVISPHGGADAPNSPQPSNACAL